MKLNYINKRTFFSTTGLNNLVTSLITYKEIEAKKALILKDNKNKAGVYRWINLVNSKSYVGSAKNLMVGFWVYFSRDRLMSSDMLIYKAILKYGYTNFRLEIL